MKVLPKNYYQFIIIMIFCSIAILLGNAYAATYYVAQNHSSASDSNPGTEFEPWEHAWYGAEQLVAGDTLIIKAGYYYRHTGDQRYPGIRPANSGTAENPITIKANPGDEVYVMGGPTIETENDNFTNPAIGARDQDHIIIDGFKVYGCATLWNSAGSTIQNCEIWEGNDRSFACCIRVEATTDCTIKNNLVRDNDLATTTVENSPLLQEYDSVNLIIEHNEFRNAVGTGVRLKDHPVNVHVRYNIFGSSAGISTCNQDNGQNVYIYQNIFNGSYLRLKCCIDGVFIYNNTFYDAEDRDIQLWHTSVTNIQIYNNIFFHPTSIIFFEPWTSDLSNIASLNHNNYYGPGKWTVDWSTVATDLPTWKGYGGWGFDVNSIDTDPLFVDAANGDFHLRVISPCKGIGKDGKDIGAYPNGDDGTVIGYTPSGSPSRPDKRFLWLSSH